MRVETQESNRSHTRFKSRGSVQPFLNKENLISKTKVFGRVLVPDALQNEATEHKLIKEFKNNEKLYKEELLEYYAEEKTGEGIQIKK